LSPATEILYGGAAGGGKSHLMRVAAIAWCYDIAGLQVYLFRRTFPDLIKNHMEGPSGFPALLADWVGSKFARINYSDNEVAFTNRSKIFLCHCQHEKDVYKYQGSEIHVLMPDELTHFAESQYRYLRSRNRMAGIELPERYRGMFPRVLAASNPGNIGHNWVKAAFVKPAPAMNIWQTPDSEGGKLRQFIPAALSDNPSLNATEYAATLQGLGRPELVKAMLEGSWDIVAGGMFDDVWDPLTHVVKPFPVPRSWRIDRSFDWGGSHPFSVGWWAESDGTECEAGCVPRGTLFRIAEWYGSTGKPDEGLKMGSKEIAQGILEHEERLGIAGRVHPGPADTQIFNPDYSSGSPSIAEHMEKVGVKWEKADKSTGSRRQGAEELRRRLKASLAVPMEDSGLFAFDTCRDFIDQIPVLPRSEKDPEDVDSASEDHIYDECRYRLLESRNELVEQNFNFWKH